MTVGPWSRVTAVSQRSSSTPWSSPSAAPRSSPFRDRRNHREDTMTSHAIGIDIGGTGIKGAIVDVATGELLTERTKVPTPEGGKPDDIVAEVVKMIDAMGSDADGLAV